MKSLTEIQKRITDLETQITAQDITTTTIQNGRIDILYWVRNNGELKTDKEVINKIERIKEELIPITDINDLWYKEKTAKIKELENCLK